MSEGPQPHTYIIGPWHFSPVDRTIRHRDGQSLKLEEKISALLLTLAEREGEIVSKDILLNEVWGGRELSEQTIPVAISKLRKALGDDINDPTMLATIPRQGYRLLPTQSGNVPPVPHQLFTKQIVMAAAAMVALFALVFFVLQSPAPEPIDRIQTINQEKPGVIVTINDVRTTPDTEQFGHLAISVSEMASFFLAQVSDILVIRHWWNLDAPDPTGGIYTRYGSSTLVFSLKGTLLQEPTGPIVTFILSDPKTDEVVWSGVHAVDGASQDLFPILQTMLAALPIAPTNSFAAPSDSSDYWNARYFMELANPGAARIAAQKLSEMEETDWSSNPVQALALAVVARWKDDLAEAQHGLDVDVSTNIIGDEQDIAANPALLVDQAALYLFRDQNAAAALSLLEAALQSAPGDHYALSLVGEAKIALGDPEGATEAFKKAVRLAPFARSYQARLAALESELANMP